MYKDILLYFTLDITCMLYCLDYITALYVCKCYSLNKYNEHVVQMVFPLFITNPWLWPRNGSSHGNVLMR